MKKRNLLVFISCFSILISCSSGSKKPKDGDYGTLTIADMDIWYGNAPKAVEYVFSKPEYAEQITYEFAGSKLLEITDNIVTLKNNGAREVEVKAYTPHISTTFKITTHPTDNFITDVSYYEKLRTAKGKNDVDLLFCGDSFFDTRHFWNNFYDQVKYDGVVFNCGISGSALKGWRGYAERLIYNCQPENIVMNCGSNDFWDTHADLDETFSRFEKLMNDIHKNLPDSNIYYFSMINRDGAIPNRTAEQTKQFVSEFNGRVNEFVKDKDYLHLCNIYDHFVNDDGSAKSELLKDGCHPKDEQYQYFVEALIQEGLNAEYINE